jgi:hypothetical protein
VAEGTHKTSKSVGAGQNRSDIAFLDVPLSCNFDFSIVTLVSSNSKYQRMRKSFERHGFTSGRSEFIAIDNREHNQLDGYQVLRTVAPKLRGRYIILAHDDIELTGEGFEELVGHLQNLDKSDPNWMVAGNAGGTPGLSLARHIDDPNGSYRIDGAAVPVNSLDENFLVMPRERIPFPSVDLVGFHLYGTDMCIQARARGGSAYVIPFLLKHHSAGPITAEYRNAARHIERVWADRRNFILIRTPTAMLYFGWIGTILRRLNDVRRSFVSLRLSLAPRTN